MRKQVLENFKIWKKGEDFYEHDRLFGCWLNQYLAGAIQGNQVEIIPSTHLDWKPIIQQIQDSVLQTDYAPIALNFHNLQLRQHILYSEFLEKKYLPEQQMICCLYYSLLMQKYYCEYGKKQAQEIVAQQCKHLSCILLRQSFELPRKPTYQEKIIKDIKYLLLVPTRTSLLLESLDILNINRLTIVFAKLTDTALIYWLALEDIFGMTPSGLQLDIIGEIFKAASVLVFFSRFVLEFGLLVKHTFFDSQGDLTRVERFMLEFGARHWRIGMNLQWAVVNLLTNYNVLFNITALFANRLLTIFLAFDMVWFLYGYTLEFMINKDSRKNYQGTQLEQIDGEWESRSQIYYFAIGSAAILASGFGASLFFTTGTAMLALCYFLGTLSAAMYQSCKSYGWYKQLIKQKNTTDDPAVMEALSALQNSIVKNIVVPMLFVAGFMYSMPLATVILMLYSGWQYSESLSLECSAGKSV